MSLSDIRDMLNGITDAGGLASGDLPVRRQGHCSQETSFHVFAFCTSLEESTALSRACFDDTDRDGFTDGDSEEWKTLRSKPLSAAKDCLVVVLTDWSAKAYLGLSTFQALAISPSSAGEESREGGVCGSCLHVQWTVTSWRRYFQSLFLHLSGGGHGDGRSAVAVQLKDKDAIGEISCPSLKTTITVRNVSSRSSLGGQLLTAWCSSRLAKEWAVARKSLEALQEEKERLLNSLNQANAKLEWWQQQQHHQGQPDSGMPPGVLSSSLESGGSSSPGVSGPTVPGRKRPVSLINPQSRTAAKRARGLKLQ